MIESVDNGIKYFKFSKMNRAHRLITKYLHAFHSQRVNRHCITLCFSSFTVLYLYLDELILSQRYGKMPVIALRTISAYSRSLRNRLRVCHIDDEIWLILAGVCFDCRSNQFHARNISGPHNLRNTVTLYMYFFLKYTLSDHSHRQNFASVEWKLSAPLEAGRIQSLETGMTP